MIVLAGDVGGTNARLATVELNGGTVARLGIKPGDVATSPQIGK